MEPIVFDNKLIVFSLEDNFARISPTTLLKEYITKLVEDGKPSITIFNLAEPFDPLSETLQVAVCEFGWPEKLAPSLEKLCALCKAIDSWLSLDDHNVAVIYSKKDLSRASLAIAVFLVYIEICAKETFDFESMSYYYRRHLHPYLQVSQKRYLNYFKSLLSGESKINCEQYVLNNLIIRGIPNFNANGFCKPFIKIYQALHLIHCSHVLDIDAEYVNKHNSVIFSLVPPLKVRGDILVKCFHFASNSSQVMFALQFHTSTLTQNELKLSKQDLDIAPVDKRFDSETTVELMFNDAKMSPRVTMTLSQARQLVKTNSYEHFLSALNNNEVEHTKGPIDGSLYATIPKRATSMPKAVPKEIDVNLLDQILNDIFYEIQAFPQVEQDKENNSVQSSLHENGTENKQESETEGKDEDVPDGDTLTWLERQKLKLKHKHDRTHHTDRRIVETKLLQELKQTKHFLNSSSASIGSESHQIGPSCVSPTVPTRKSSKLLAPLVALSSQGSTIESIASPIQFSLQESNQIVVRSSTPSFPVANFCLGDPNEGVDAPAFFIKDTSAFWYKPHLSREEAVRLLRNQPTGTFIIRDSNSFHGAFGLAIKVADHCLDSRTMNGTELDHTDLVRHFLIESTPKGVQIKGCPSEPVFSSLASLVYQHSLTRISLPTKLTIPTHDLDDNSSELMEIYENGAMCELLYFTCQDVESLTGPNAIQKVIDDLLDSGHPSQCHRVHLKASIKGITLTDNSHRIFFRQHYPLSGISYFMADPKQRTFSYRKDNHHVKSELFGFVAQKKGSNMENECLILGHYETDQPAHAIIDFVNKLLAL